MGRRRTAAEMLDVAGVVARVQVVIRIAGPLSAKTGCSPAETGHRKIDARRRREFSGGRHGLPNEPSSGKKNQ